MVAYDAVSGDWLIPMKRNETIEIKGSPPTRPPRALPYLSTMSVAELTHAPPTTNARIRRRVRRSVIDDYNDMSTLLRPLWGCFSVIHKSIN